MRAFAMAAVLLVAAVGLTPRADAQAAKKLSIGIPQSTFRDVPAVIMDAAATPFRELFRRQAGLDGDVQLVPSYDALAAQMQAVLVVHKDGKATRPADLAGACVGIPVGSKPHCHLFIERLRLGLPADCCGEAKTEPKGQEDVLDGVAAKQLQAGLVDIAALTAYQNNCPGGFAQVRVVAQSELFPPGVIAYRKGAVDAATVSKMHGGLTKAGGTPQGRAFMLLSKMKGFEDVPADFDAELKRIAAAYPPPAPPK